MVKVIPILISYFNELYNYLETQASSAVFEKYRDQIKEWEIFKKFHYPRRVLYQSIFTSLKIFTSDGK